MAQSNGLICIFERISELNRHLVFPPFFSVKNNTAMNMFVVKSLCIYIIQPLDEFLELKMLAEEYKFAGF